eukprot:gnl/TRDRNA2_/TRDRNA2_156373_c0_seq1.p1 gnl/TRDRNA2_/TRDRNA2_156373_c0~~gnl/TRDRNA2_/TRDRNA2_156373_c0_seq1.p1  ORF type:complete len:300 (+),score=21.41 gnl/TRDRNA2_/TRDRNA2_156373_c0_seq1:533-1432(+)
MPEYCASAAYYRERYPKEKGAPLLLCPYKRYHFWTPKGARPGRSKNIHRKKALGTRNSPFVAFWYMRLHPVCKRKSLVKMVKRGELGTVNMVRRRRKLADGEAEAGVDTVGTVRCRLCRNVGELPECRAKFKANTTKEICPSAEERRPASNVTQKIENDTCDRLAVWWEGPDQMFVQELDPGESTVWYIFIGNHELLVCIRYTVPGTFMVEREKCKATWSPPQEREERVVKVSNIIGPGTLPLYSPGDGEISNNQELSVYHVGHYTLGLSLIAFCIFVLTGLKKLRDFQPLVQGPLTHT